MDNLTTKRCMHQAGDLLVSGMQDVAVGQLKLNSPIDSVIMLRLPFIYPFHDPFHGIIGNWDLRAQVIDEVG